MATVLTNQVASQSLRGQDVKVTLNSVDSLAFQSQILKGQACTIVSSSFTGYISSVDSFGNSFKITPVQPDKNLSSSSTPGFLAAADTVSIAF